MNRDIPMGTIFSGVMWFIPAYLITAIVMVAYPRVVLFLPSLVR